MFHISAKGPSMKDISSQGGFVKCGQGAGKVLQMQSSALFGAKNFGFLEIYGVSAW